MRRFERAYVVLAALAAYGVALFSRGWPRDDRWLILEHPLLRAGWAGARELLSSGYVQPLLGAETPIHEWRPVLSLTFLLQRVTTGFSPLPLHAVNVLLHIAVCLLVLEALRRRLPQGALAGALCFAVLPVHGEVVAYVSSRSELLSALSVLGAWLLLGAPGKPRVLAGCALYALGCLSKESAMLFPLFLAMSDWTFGGNRPWNRKVYLALGLVAALVLAGRALVLPTLAGGGVPYFATTPVISRLLTLAKFWSWWYLRPAVTGTGICVDFSRPMIPDAATTDIVAWVCLLALIGMIVAALNALRKRKAWGFWLLAPCVFLLPTSHLLMNLDTLGAQRFLYLPGLAVAAGFALIKDRRAAALILLGFTSLAFSNARRWRDDVAFYEAAAACNPVSAKVAAGLGGAYLRAGRDADGEAQLRRALSINPHFFDASMNLAMLSYGRKDYASARTFVNAALAERPFMPGALTLQALLDEREGKTASAAAALARAVAVAPDNPVARFNFARQLALAGRPAQAAEQIRAFLRLAPDDADAPQARKWLMELEAAK
jgi:tetratricopeptide (TPR) repeat protein